MEGETFYEDWDTLRESIHMAHEIHYVLRLCLLRQQVKS